ncbi:MAG: hypothetical protein HYT87_14080 [Nitrospirae bacterium]|nr:hypothetical protein [Nitrospirota bacterium]
MKTVRSVCWAVLFVVAGCSAEDEETGKAGDTSSSSTSTSSSTTTSTSSAASSPKYTVTDLKWEEDPTLHYVNVSGAVTRDSEAGTGTKATVNYYSDDYVTVIDSVKQTLGAGITAKGGRERIKVSSLKVYVFPATGGFFKVCVDFSSENSNYATPTKVGCFNPKYTVSNLALTKDSLNYAVVTGTVVRDSDHGSATQATVRYYSDDYTTLIDSADEEIGEDVKTQGGQQVMKISSLKVYLLPSSGGFAKVCADFSAKNSNYTSPTQLGCLTGSK